MADLGMKTGRTGFYMQPQINPPYNKYTLNSKAYSQNNNSLVQFTNLDRTQKLQSTQINGYNSYNRYTNVNLILLTQ